MGDWVSERSLRQHESALSRAVESVPTCVTLFSEDLYLEDNHRLRTVNAECAFCFTYRAKGHLIVCTRRFKVQSDAPSIPANKAN